MRLSQSVPGEAYVFAPGPKWMPGDLTRWIWFGDAFSWAAMPINGAHQDHQRSILITSDKEKLKYFENRVPTCTSQLSRWTGACRGLWSGFGVVVKRKRPDNLSEELKKIIPEYLYVETQSAQRRNQKPNAGTTMNVVHR